MARAQHKASLFLMVMMHCFFLFFRSRYQRPGLYFFSTTGPQTWHGHKHLAHVETAIGVEGFIAVQLACQRGLHPIQGSGALQKLPHGKIGCLVGVGEPMSRDGKIDKMMGGSLLSVKFRVDGMIQRFG